LLSLRNNDRGAPRRAAPPSEDFTAAAIPVPAGDYGAGSTGSNLNVIRLHTAGASGIDAYLEGPGDPLLITRAISTRVAASGGSARLPRTRCASRVLGAAPDSRDTGFRFSTPARTR